jgi:hypothetical protein
LQKLDLQPVRNHPRDALAQATNVGDGVTLNEKFAILVTTSPTVCVYATVQSDDGKLFERAPGDGTACVVLTLGSGVPFIGFG